MNIKFRGAEDEHTDNMVNQDYKDKDILALIKYIAEEDRLEKLLENKQVINTPVVRNGKVYSKDCMLRYVQR